MTLTIDDPEIDMTRQDTSWIAEPHGKLVSAVTPVSLELRNALRDGPDDLEIYRAHFNAFEALKQIELGGPPPIRARTTNSLRVAAWNVERLRHIDDITETLRREAPDVALLTEIDKGMVRSGNTHRMLDISERLGMGYALGIEFVELDRGDIRERAAHGNEENELGFIGNGFLSGLTFHKPFILRLEADGDWFSWERGEPRVGGRLGLGAQVELDGQMVTIVSVHFESHGTPEERAEQMKTMLDIIDRFDPEAPVIIGGDFNTNTFQWYPGFFDSAAFRAAMDEAPDRRTNVLPHEPMFPLAEARGYDYRLCNVPDVATQRFPDMSDPSRIGKIDWFFTRGLETLKTWIVPAYQADGKTPSTDHDLLMVEVALPG